MAFTPNAGPGSNGREAGSTRVAAGLQRDSVTVDTFTTPEEFRDFFKANYGPTVAAHQSLADGPARAAALDADLVELARRHDTSNDTTPTVVNWEYPWSRPTRREREAAGLTPWVGGPCA